MFIDKCLKLLIGSLIVALAVSAAFAQDKADKKGGVSAEKPAAHKAEGDPAAKTGAPVQTTAKSAAAEAPKIAAESDRNAKPLSPAPSVKKAEGETPAAAPKEAAAPPPAAPPPPAPLIGSSPVFYSSYPTGIPPMRFLERTGHPGPLAAPPKPLPLPPPVHRSAGAPIAIALVYDRAWSKDKGFDLFGDKNRLKQFGVWASYDIWSLSKRAILAAEVGWSGWVEKSHEMDGALGTQLGMSRVHIGANLRYVIEPWLQPHLRIAAGGSFLDIEIRSTENNLDTTFRDWHFAPFASLGAGFLLRTPTRLFESRSGDFASLSMGVLLEGGYLLSGAPSFSLKPKDRPDNLIALTSADLGKLDCSAGYFRISLVVRF